MNPSHIPGRPLSTARIQAARIATALAYRPGRPLATSPTSALRRYAAGAGDMPTPSNLQPLDTASAASEQGGASTGGSLVSNSFQALPAPNSSVYSSSQVIVLTQGSGLNLRSGPSTGASVVALEPDGTVLTVVGGQQNGWLNVQDPSGRTGWVYSGYVVDAGAQSLSNSIATASAPSATPSVLGPASSSVAGSGVVGLLVVGGALVGAYWLLVK